MWINWGNFDPHFSRIRNKNGGVRFILGYNLSIYVPKANKVRYRSNILYCN
jgi:hypothetical protein